MVRAITQVSPATTATQEGVSTFRCFFFFLPAGCEAVVPVTTRVLGSNVMRFQELGEVKMQHHICTIALVYQRKKEADRTQTSKIDWRKPSSQSPLAGGTSPEYNMRRKNDVEKSCSSKFWTRARTLSIVISQLHQTGYKTHSGSFQSYLVGQSSAPMCSCWRPRPSRVS